MRVIRTQVVQSTIVATFGKQVGVFLGLPDSGR